MNTEKLHAKLVDLLTYLEKTKGERKASNQGFSEVIKETQKKVDAISKALKTGDKTHLYEGYSYDEIESLLECKKKVDAISKALKTGETSHIYQAFSQEDLA